MKKAAFLAGAALAGLGALLIAPSAVGDPRITVPFVPVSVTVPSDGGART
ncbi:MAG: hypothetical protein ABW137_15890 [Mycobacterium sp.]